MTGSGSSAGPTRVQQRRRAGWRKPPGAVSVARPHRFHNPHRVDAAAGVDRAEAVRRFREDLVAGRLGYTVDDVRRELRGRDLMCFCPVVDDRGEPVPCHAQVLLEVANPLRTATVAANPPRAVRPAP
ncbi:DUF4326 domain-containing protein [Phycicoccus flavus]|uniref:DUF4326 domain-containing protein n=1 Tax=Phycicoccus flavus TaxID=2502783 RepID=UPI000FEBE6AC|nr:DUF4326 domain-containing protein [Phycicoccus flavus]NHA69793.1 DUF4326 domain-containing protein [Phycicoccus flavus]